MSASKVRLLCITDPSTHPPFDTTVELYQRLSSHPHFELFHCNPNEVTEEATIPARQVKDLVDFAAFEQIDHLPAEARSFAEFDGVFCRSDDPLPDKYLEKLARHEHHTRFINRPSGLVEVHARAFHREIAAESLPEHLATRDCGEAARFIRSVGVVVAKQEHTYGGKGIFKISTIARGAVLERGLTGIREEFPSVDALVAMLLTTDDNPFEFVRFLKNVDQGDKRVLVVDGEIYGAMLRRAPQGSWINNVTAGGSVSKAEISARERQIISETTEAYRKRGVNTLGYDFLMDDDGSWILSEINAGNIGGYGRVERLIGEPIFERLFSWMIRFLSK